MNFIVEKTHITPHEYSVKVSPTTKKKLKNGFYYTVGAAGALLVGAAYVQDLKNKRETPEE